MGWVSASDISGCAASATSELQSDSWTGWIRAIAGGSAQSGGWDGCISLSGTGYGVVLDTATGSFKPCDSSTQSCAWEGNTDVGAAVIGWVDFSNAKYQSALSCQVPPHLARCGVAANGEDPNATYDSINDMLCTPCAAGSTCSNGACVVDVPGPECNIPNGSGLEKCIDVHPILVGPNTQATVRWDVSNVKGICTVTGSNGDGPPDTDWSTDADAAGNVAADTAISSVLTAVTIFTLTCTGLDDKTYTWTATAEIAPSFREQ